MRILALTALFATLLLFAACGDDEPAAPTTPSGAVKGAPAGTETATVEFVCSDPECDKTKTAPVTDPPS